MDSKNSANHEHNNGILLVLLLHLLEGQPTIGDILDFLQMQGKTKQNKIKKLEISRL